MDNPWNSAAFPKEEHKLMDIMSEELGKQLQIEDDFVWVTKSDSVSSDSDIIPFTNIVQSELESKRFEVEETDKICDSDDSGITQPNVDEHLDEFYNWKYKNDNKRPVNMVKCTHTPQHMKCTEHRSHKRYNISRQADPTARYSNNSKNQKSKETALLPTIDFGEATNALLKRIIDQRYVAKYDHVVGRGKNSVVFYARHHRRNCITMTFENAVKVYKLSNNDDDNKTIYKRVQREFEHMTIVYNKLRVCPWPLRAWDNVILMSFAGYSNDDTSVAPSVKDITPSEGMYWWIVSYIDQFYDKLHLVHGKLCARNIRYNGNRLDFIGWGHSVKRDHPLALPKLIKDCHYVTKFYTQRGFKVPATEDLFQKITGCTKINGKLLDVIKKQDLYEKYSENPNKRYHKPNGNLRFK